MRKNCRKSWMTGLLVLCMSILMVFAAHAEDSNTTTVSTLSDGSVVQTVSDITQYRTEGNFTAPKAPEGYENYIFSGWYTNQSCTSKTALAATVTSENIGENTLAYAKFVPKEVLGVRAQVTVATQYKSDTANIRFVTSVDSANYKAVGFDCVQNGKSMNGESNSAYKKLQVLNNEGKIMNYTPWNVFHSMSKYFMAATLPNVVNADFGDGIAVTPYWITLDGTKVPGETVTKTINMSYTSSMETVATAKAFDISRKNHDCGWSCIGILGGCEDSTKYVPQGGCTDGTYYYQALIYDANTSGDTYDKSYDSSDRVYIRKHDMDNDSTVKISADLNLHHANDMTYNPDLKYGDREGLLVVMQNHPVYTRLSFLHPDDLTVIDPEEITDLNGEKMDWAWLVETAEEETSYSDKYVEFSTAGIGGVYSINYNPTYKKYVVGLSGGQSFTFLDANLKNEGTVYSPTSKAENFTTQGNTCDDGYIYFILYGNKMDSEGAELQYNSHIITVYDWDGNFVTVLEIPIESIPLAQEPENISIYDNKIYISCSNGDNATVYQVDKENITYAEGTVVATIERNGTTEEYVSLEEAMMDAEANETITIVAENVEVGSQMEMLAENVTLTNKAGVDVTITRKNSYTGTLIDNSAQNFTIKSNESGSLTFDGAGTKKGNSWLANSVDGELKLENITVQNVSANKDGGAVRIEAGQVTIKDCEFKNNVNSAEGGAIYSNGTLNVEDSIFESNSATNGGAICNRQETAILNIRNCKFGGTTTDETGETVGLGNKASSSGGAIYNGGNGAVIINGDSNEQSTFEGNQASGSTGGGAICIGTGTLTLDGYAFKNNKATIQGGAIALRGGLESTISNSSFEGNEAETKYGGAIHNRLHRPTITNCTFDGNKALLYGGALYNEFNGQVTLNIAGETENKVLTNNSAGTGGAITNTSGKVSVVGYTFDSNKANKVVIGTETSTAEDGTETVTDIYSDAFGGAIYSKKMEDAYDTTVETTDCVFQGNSSEANGGAIYNDTSASCTVQDTQFTGNKAGADGGAIYNSATLNLVGTKGDEETVTAVFDNNGFVDGATSVRGAAIYNGNTLNATAYVFKNHVTTGNGGAICNYGRNPKFTNCQFISNQGAIGGALYSGGGVKIYLNVSAEVPELTALCEGNIATTRGGAIGAGYGHTYVDGYEFKDNHAPYGGALYLENDKQTKDEEGNTVTVGADSSITNSKFSGNYSTCSDIKVNNGGGAIYVFAGEADIEACNFNSNTSTTHAGAVYTKAVTDVTGCTFTSNKATMQGGAIKVEGSTAQLNVTKTTFGGSEEILGNIAETSGGAIYGAGSTTIIVGTENGTKQATEIFENNKANAEFGGGAICVGSGILRVYGYEFTDNYAVKEGGAIAKRNNAELTVKDALFESNETGDVGGAIRSYATTSTIENTTFTKNIAATRGGAIYTADLTVDLDGSSFNENSAVYGGAINCEGGTLEATSCHFTGNISTAEMTTADARKTELTGRGGGAVNLTGNAKGTFDGTGTFASNKAENALGGAIYTTDAELSITGYTFSENIAYQAGAILIDNVMEDAEDETLCETDIKIENSKFEKNQSTEDGGAIWSIQRKLVLGKTNANAETIFDDNYSAGDGGAIKLENVGGELDVSNYTFINNEAGAQGGAIECHADKATISSCTFGGEGQGNIAGTNGGAFYAGTSCVTEFKIKETSYTEAKFVENKATEPTYGGGAICMGSGNLTITGYTFEDNTSGTQGGAIHHNSTNATMNVTNSTFDTNIAETYGGAITGNGTDITLDNTKFISNKATTNRGGAVYVWAGSVITCKVDSGSDLALFQKNESKDGGGAICMGSGELQVTGYTFDDNNTTNYGGAVRLNNSAIKATFTNSTFSNNDANTQGGAIFSGYSGNDAVAFDVTNCKFDTNASKYGGAIYIHTGNQKVTLTGGTNALFTNNNATADGGAIYFDKSTNTESSITGYTFSNNSATIQGGAIGLGTTTLTVSESDFTENSSVYGGAINSYKSTFTTNNCDFTGNKSLEASTDSLVGKGGGALNIVGNSDATINGGAFSQNSTNEWGGAIYTTDSSMTIYGSVLDGNTAKHAAAILIDSACEEGDTLNTDTIYVRNTEIKNNIATNSGGAIYVNNRNLTLEKTEDTANAIVSGNQSQTAAGGAIFMGSGNLTIKGYTVQGNSAKTTGGAIQHANASGRLDVYDSVFTSNSSEGLGGALYVKSSMEVDGCEFNQNESTGANGGAISIDGITVEDKAVIKNSTFNQNKVMAEGNDLGEGSSVNMPGSTWLTLENCQFAGGETKTDTTRSNCGYGDVRLGNNSTDGGLKISGKMVVDVYFNQRGKLIVSDSLTEGSAVVTNWRKDKITEADITYEGIKFVSEADMNASKGYIKLSDTQNGTYAIKFADDKGTLVKATKVTTEEEFTTALTTISASDEKIGAVVLGADITISAKREFPTGCDITIVDDGTTRKFVRSGEYKEYLLNVTSGATVTFASTGGDNTNPRLIIDGGNVECTGGNTLLENNGTLTVCQGMALQNNQTSGGNQGIALYSKAGSTTTFKGAIRNITSTYVGDANPSSVMVYGKLTFDNAIVENNVTNKNGLVRISKQSGQEVGGNLTANNTEFKNNTAGANGGIINVDSSASTVQFEECIFNINTAGGMGGAIYNTGSSTNIINCTFNTNTATGAGGAIYNTGSNMKLTNNVFESNSSAATEGAGGAICNHGADPIITDCKFITNHSTAGNGGAIYCGSSKTVTITVSEQPTVEALFQGNTSSGYGGAIGMGSGTLILTGYKFSGNAATGGKGGAIYTAGDVASTITASTSENALVESVFENNTATAGGAIFINGKLTSNIQGYIFNGNTATGSHGGAIYVGGGHAVTANIDNCKFVENKSPSYRGGAIYSGNVSTVNLTTNNGSNKAIFEKNTAKQGGAICIGSGTLNVTGYTFDANYTTEAVGGGAIKFNDTSMTSNLNDCVFKNNEAQKGGAICADAQLETETHAANNQMALSITDCSFEGNKANDAASYGNKGGGAIFANTGVTITLTVTDSTKTYFKNNTSNYMGGAIFYWGTLNDGGYTYETDTDTVIKGTSN